MYRLTLLFTISTALAIVWGCGPADQNGTSPPAGDDLGYDAAHDHGHDHGHAHSHEQAGPHEGHLIKLGDEEYHAEWLHDDATGLVTVYLLDSDMKNEVAIPAASIKIETTIDQGTTRQKKEYLLMAVEPTSDDPPRAARFEMTDKSLIEALKIAGPGVEAKVLVEIDGKSFVGDFEHEPH